MLEQITKSSLVRNQNYINGNWVNAKNAATFEVCNPATGDCLIAVPNLSRQEVETAIEAAHEAFKKLV
jgi:NAD-dependent aldehyde dehydrogenases